MFSNIGYRENFIRNCFGVYFAYLRKSTLSHYNWVLQLKWVNVYFRIYAKYTQNNFKDVFSISYFWKYIFRQILAKTIKSSYTMWGSQNWPKRRFFPLWASFTRKLYMRDIIILKFGISDLKLVRNSCPLFCVHWLPTFVGQCYYYGKLSKVWH